MATTHRGLLALAVLILIAGTAGCGPAAGPAEHELTMASMSDMPLEVQQATVDVQQAYQFAVANPDLVQHLPCYCGCGQLGHKSNYDCYVAGQDADGHRLYDRHALNCLICVDITQDAMRLLRDGQSTAEIRAYVDAAYYRYGPSNMPAVP